MKSTDSWICSDCQMSFGAGNGRHAPGCELDCVYPPGSWTPGTSLPEPDVMKYVVEGSMDGFGRTPFTCVWVNSNRRKRAQCFRADMAESIRRITSAGWNVISVQAVST